jgi:hypothetical protein
MAVMGAGYAVVRVTGGCPCRSLIAPDDRLDFLEALTSYYFGKSTDLELSQIVKVKDR